METGIAFLFLIDSYVGMTAGYQITSLISCKGSLFYAPKLLSLQKYERIYIWKEIRE